MAARAAIFGMAACVVLLAGLLKLVYDFVTLSSSRRPREPWEI